MGFVQELRKIVDELFDMSKRAATWDAKEMMMRGLMAFGRAMGMSPNPMSDGASNQVHYTKEQQIRRARSHAKFKAQRIARRRQRQLMKARA